MNSVIKNSYINHVELYYSGLCMLSWVTCKQVVAIEKKKNEWKVKMQQIQYEDHPYKL